MKAIKSHLPTILLTGASTGIGLSTCQYLAKKNYLVFATVRKEKDYQSLLDQENIVPLKLDVRKQTEIEEAVKVIKTLPNGLFGLINNAGIAIPGPLACLPIEEFEYQMDVNVTGLLRTSQAFIPFMSSGSKLINVSSMAGKVSFPGLGAYHASKHAVEAISDVLRLELKPKGINVSIIEPGRIATPIWKTSRDYSAKTLSEIPNSKYTPYKPLMEAVQHSVRDAESTGASPLLCAKAIHHALKSNRPRTRYTVGLDAKIYLFMRRFLLSDRIWDAILSKTLSKGSSSR